MASESRGLQGLGEVRMNSSGWNAGSRINPNTVNPSHLAWQRFSRGLPENITSVEIALETNHRTFEQWRICLDTANHFAARVYSNVHRRGMGDRPNKIAWRALRALSSGQNLTAEELRLALGGVHVDVVRRAMKTFREKNWVTSSEKYTKFDPRRFEITELGRMALQRLEVN
jgi:hypothetical protein